MLVTYPINYTCQWIYIQPPRAFGHGRRFGHSGDKWMQEAVQKEKSRGGKKHDFSTVVENPWASSADST